MAEWVKEDLARGKVTPEQAATCFAELNTPLELREQDKRTPDQIEFDRLFPVPKSGDYTIRYGLCDHEEMSADLKQFDSSARTWLSEAQFPREIGNSLVNSIDRVTRETAHLSEPELELYGRTEYAKLERLYGDTLAERLQRAGAMVQELEKKQPRLNALLRSQALGDNALIASLLIQQSERYFARKAR